MTWIRNPRWDGAEWSCVRWLLFGRAEQIDPTPLFQFVTFTEQFAGVPVKVHGGKYARVKVCREDRRMLYVSGRTGTRQVQHDRKGTL